MNKIFDRWNYLRSQKAFQRSPLWVLWRLLVWRIRCIIRKPAVISLPKYSIRMFLPPQWRGTAKLIYAFREDYEIEIRLLERLLTAGATTLDIGANYGIYSLIMARIIGNEGRVLAFEPARNNYQILQKNIALNHLSQVTCFPYALADWEGETVLYHEEDPDRNSLGKSESSVDSEIVMLRTLDKLAEELGLNSCQFIKCDTEGAEELVFRGGKTLLSVYKPTILLEFNPSAARRLGLHEDGAIKFLRSLGYQLFISNDGENLMAVDNPAPGNIIAIHPKDT